MKLKYIIIFITLPFFLKAQGGLIIGNGANVVINNSPHIVVQNGKFENNGDFTAGNSSVYLTGNTATENSTIGGAAITNFNNLILKKNANDVRLEFDILIEGNLQLDGGLLFLNQNEIELGGDIIGETETERITGTEGGAIIKTLDLGIPVSANPGNLGAEISSPFDLGMTTIRRSHVQMENDGNVGIYRRYDIDPETNSELEATLRFHYFDAELAGLEEGDLEAWHNDEIDWESYGSENSSMPDNWVEVSGISFFHTFTLAGPEGSLPIELLRFDAILNESKGVDLSWTTATEINNDYFTVERSMDGIQFEAIEDIPGAGNTIQVRNYKTEDPNPHAGTSYYRLRQIDFDGTQSLSEIRVIHIDLNQQYTVYPNPLKEVLHIVRDASAKGKTIIEISDVLGNTRYYNRLEIGTNINTIDIQEVAKFEAGNYFLTIQTADKTFTFNLVKVRK